MIRFRHRVTDWSTLELLCDGHSGERGKSLPCAAASALMAAACCALEKRKAPRLRIETGDGSVHIHCAYTPQTAEIAMVTICGFDWLAEQAPEEVRSERLRPPEKNEKK